MIPIIIILMVVITALLIMYVLQNRQIRYYKAAMGNMAAMAVMQRMFEIMASSIPAKNKIEELNNIIIDVFNSKYSTISLFDGTEYEVKATNVEEMYIGSIKDIAEEADFKNNAVNNISKYLVASGPRILGYKSGMERKIKSAMFSPIYYNGTYLGFWLLEDKMEGAYDNMSKEELAKLKNNIGVFIENIIDQENIEKAYNTDKQTGFYNSIYLYSNARQKISVNDVSSVILVSLSNLPSINDKYSRELGDRLLGKTAKLLKETLSTDCTLVRYTGSRFAAICPGVSSETIHTTIERFSTNAKMIEEMQGNSKVILNVQVLIHTLKKQSNVEKELNKMNTYLEGMEEGSSIKII